MNHHRDRVVVEVVVSVVLVQTAWRKLKVTVEDLKTEPISRIAPIVQIENR